MANLADVFVTLNYDVAVEALFQIRNATLIWKRDPEAMSEKLKAINALAQSALNQITVRTSEEFDVADTPAFVAATELTNDEKGIDNGKP